MSDAAIPRTFQMIPAPPRAIPAPIPPPAPAAAPDPIETSPWLAGLAADASLAASARRAGTGLVLTLPFTIAAGLRAERPVEALVAALSLPVGLAMIALVGVAASTLGVSLASVPLEPAQAATIASRGVFRTGVLLAGLAPVTALWVAGGRPLEGLFAGTVAIAVAGASGIGTIARGLLGATAETDGTWRGAAVLVALLFVLFSLVVGVRLWLGAADDLSASLLGGEL